MTAHAGPVLIRPKVAADPPVAAAEAAWLERALGLASSLAVFIARTDDLQAMLEMTARLAADGLAAHYAKLLVYDPERRAFLLQAGVGWRAGFVGRTWLDADVGTAAGFAWHTGQAVISDDLQDGRFRTSDILAAHNIVSCINVVIPGRGEQAFGVLGVESPLPGDFSTRDLDFLRLVANLLGVGAGRCLHQARQSAAMDQAAMNHDASLREMQHRVRNDLQGIVNSVAAETRLTADPAPRAGLERINRRIIALAGLYDHLLRGADGPDVDFGAYLRVLCDKINASSDLALRGIVLVADTNGLRLPADRALRLAVAVNELVANAVEHAFPHGSGGRIGVGLAPPGQSGDSPAVLTVKDDGRGFAGGRPGGAGLTFVQDLVRQAEGRLSREDGHGTLWRISLCD